MKTKQTYQESLGDYLRYSSFPQAVELYKINPENITLFLDGIYHTILLKDVMQRKGITDKNVLEKVTKYLYDNIGNRTSIKSISDNIEGVEKNSSYNTISNYIDALIDSYLIFKANRYDIKRKRIFKNTGEILCCGYWIKILYVRTKLWSRYGTYFRKCCIS